MSQVSTPPVSQYVMPVRQQGPSLASMLPEHAARLAWRWRWQLAPVAAAAGVLTCDQSPTLGVTMALGAGGAYWTSRAGYSLTVAGTERMFLSRRERWIASTWLGAASAWTLTASVVHMPPRAAVATLAAALGWPSYQWATSRMPKRARLSPQARALVDGWRKVADIHARVGPAPILGSAIVRSTITEPGPGAVTFEVALRGDVHGRDAATDACRQAVERLLELPVDTVSFTVVRDDSGRVRVTLSPNRHLEAAPVEWPGPILDEDGQIPLGVEPNGRRVAIALFNEEGVEHAVLTGTTGVGKTGTVAAISLPGPSYRVETLWFLDGGEGTSAPFLRGACDWYAMSPPEWEAAIEAAYAVLLERKYRRGRGAHGLGLEERSSWRMREETDPILTLFIEEATTVGKRIKGKHHTMIVEIAREGRKLGVRVVQVVQGIKAELFIGGIEARNLMTGGGSVIALRPGGSNDSRLTLDSTDVDIDLRALPPEPGFAAVVRRGKVLAAVMRVANAKPRAADEAAKVTPRPLEGRDELAAGANYLKRHDPDAFIPAQTDPGAAADADDGEETAQQTAEADAVALRLIRESEEGLTLVEIGGSEDGKVPAHPEWRWSRRTASKALMRLNGRELATKRGARWVALGQRAEAS